MGVLCRLILFRGPRSRFRRRKDDNIALKERGLNSFSLLDTSTDRLTDDFDRLSPLDTPPTRSGIRVSRVNHDDRPTRSGNPNIQAPDQRKENPSVGDRGFSSKNEEGKQKSFLTDPLNTSRQSTSSGRITSVHVIKLPRQ